ncbi:hypothetical protein O3P69_004345 [Scylla paramamosain]|uniref:Uncharacterized protein n=2 Tax=Scylla paramamosain TaxID=85552 RepID=A0AAW0UBT9_SCYPA
MWICCCPDMSIVHIEHTIMGKGAFIRKQHTQKENQLPVDQGKCLMVWQESVCEMPLVHLHSIYGISSSSTIHNAHVNQFSKCEALHVTCMELTSRLRGECR